MFTKSFAAMSALSLFASTANALDASLKNNVAVYWGQGADQPRLSHFCEQTSMDIINIGFIHEFPSFVGDFPGSNFGNQCDGVLFEGTNLLSGCHQIWEDIPKCKAAGKTILLSIGGGTATGESLPNDATATWFADFLWYSFGPYNPLIASLSWTAELRTTAFPRPLLDNSIDGFDFDVEYNGGAGMSSNALHFNIPSNILNRIRHHDQPSALAL
jgi:chitinase